jgi:F420H(2)-dependent biliverdin reductase
MADGDTHARLASERNVWLATVRPDGRPHVAAVWFVFVAGRFWIGTGAGSVKVRNIGGQTAVSVTLEDGDRPVCAEGHAVVHPDRRPSPVVEAFMSKYGWDVTRPDDADVGTIVLVEVTVDRWLSGGPDAQ